MVANKSLFFICTGLGNIHRGFETYIHQLATHLYPTLPIQVLSGNVLPGVSYPHIPIWHCSRRGWLAKLLFKEEHRRFAFEQMSFFVGMLFMLHNKKQKVFYLGEYQLYCYLYKWRKWWNLSYSLVLYTGGQASPGLFHPEKDFVHHITDVYIPYTTQLGFPRERQWLLPHFLDIGFTVDAQSVLMIREQAKGKKILLSVGLLDISVKRMHLIASLLKNKREEVFVILIGGDCSETPAVKAAFNEAGWINYQMLQVPRALLGNYYAAADCFILCSEKESFGLAYIEAASMNLPVIAHNFKEIEFVMQGNAFLVDMNAANAAASVEKIIDSMPVVDTRKWVEDTYSWLALREKYISMFTAFAAN